MELHGGKASAGISSSSNIVDVRFTIDRGAVSGYEAVTPRDLRARSMQRQLEGREWHASHCLRQYPRARSRDKNQQLTEAERRTVFECYRPSRVRHHFSLHLYGSLSPSLAPNQLFCTHIQNDPLTPAVITHWTAPSAPSLFGCSASSDKQNSWAIPHGDPRSRNGACDTRAKFSDSFPGYPRRLEI